MWDSCADLVISIGLFINLLACIKAKIVMVIHQPVFYTKLDTNSRGLQDGEWCHYWKFCSG